MRVVSHDGVEYEVVGNATMGADNERVVVLRDVRDGSLKVEHEVVMGGVVLNRDGTRTPIYREVK